VFADDGLPAGELRPIVTADDLWADEMVARIAARLGFADELAAAVGR
jgi:putative tRNA adenosine deaminase-associated protein